MAAHPASAGKLVISLDFELHWGVFDSKDLDRYRGNLLGARQAIPRILDLFRAYQVRSTWAVVGFLGCADPLEVLQRAPRARPTYAQASLDSYRLLPNLGQSEQEDPIHFAKSLLNRIASTPGQEIGSHTFSHYYCRAQGQNAEQFREDLLASIDILSQWQPVRSLIFPRNTSGYLDICREAGLRTYREEPDHWIFEPVNRGLSGWLKRFLKLLDSYLNLTGDNAWDQLDSKQGVLNVRASRFLRPAQARAPWSWLEPLRLRRIKDSMTSAAQKGRVYHLWWHPHNMGANSDLNLSLLEDVLRHFDRLRQQYGFTSASMGDFSDKGDPQS